MEETNNKRGRKAKSESENKTGYIKVNDKIRIRVETDCLIIEEVVGQNKETKEDIYGNNKYFTSWEGVLGWLIRRFTTDKIAKKGMLQFSEAKNEILSAIKEVKSLLLGDIDREIKSGNKDIKKFIR